MEEEEAARTPGPPELAWIRGWGAGEEGQAACMASWFTGRGGSGARAWDGTWVWVWVEEGSGMETAGMWLVTFWDLGPSGVPTSPSSSVPLGRRSSGLFFVAISQCSALNRFHIRKKNPARANLIKSRILGLWTCSRPGPRRSGQVPAKEPQLETQAALRSRLWLGLNVVAIETGCAASGSQSPSDRRPQGPLQPRES